jgi:phosphate transport system substrate-binding protein
MRHIFLVFVALLAMGSAFSVQARDQLRIVGSSTVYPFASFVAEEFGAVTRFPTPVVESTGTGGGMKIFCSGNSMDTPDITNASRRIKIKEMYLCERNGVNNITEVMFGYDGIVIAQSNVNEGMAVTKKELLLALARQVPNEDNSELVENPYQYWSEINPELPKRQIKVYGPPISSGTRDAFEEIVLQYQTEEMKIYRDAGLKGYRLIRTDGVYIPSGENDNLIVKKLGKDTDAVGIFGYSFLMENQDSLSGIPVDGVMPSTEVIASQEYPISRSMFFYVKTDHMDEVPAMKEYIEMFMNPMIIGEGGILEEIGLIPMKNETIARNLEKVENRENLTQTDLRGALAVN